MPRTLTEGGVRGIMIPYSRTGGVPGVHHVASGVAEE